MALAGLAVRTVAPFRQRLRRVQDLSKLQRSDAERAAFIRKYFAADIDDALN